MQLWRILKNHGDILAISLFGKTTTQPLRKFEPWKPWKYKRLCELGPDSKSCKNINVVVQSH